MMQDLNHIKQEMERSGELAKVNSLANTKEAAEALQAIDPEMLSAAASSKDPAVIRAMLQQLLSTDAGKRLAEKVKAAMDRG